MSYTTKCHSCGSLLTCVNVVTHIQDIIALQLHRTLDHDSAATAVQPALVRRHDWPHQAVIAYHLVEALRVGPKLWLASLHDHTDFAQSCCG